MTATSPFTCALDVRASLGECPLWSAASRRAVLGRHQCAIAQPLRPGQRPQRRDADARVDRQLRAARRRRLRRRAAQRHLAHRCRWHPRTQGRAAAVRSGALPFQRRPLRSAGPLRRRLDEREARCGRCRTLSARSRFQTGAPVRKHHDQQRSRVEPGRPHDVSRGHACANGSRIRLRRRFRHAGERSDVRALDRRNRAPGWRHRR